MKKLMALLLAGIMVFTLVACGEDKANEATEETKQEATEETKQEASNAAEAEKTPVTETLEPEEKADDDSTGIEGVWAAVSMDTGDVEVSAEEKEMIDEMLGSIKITFNSDSTVVMDMDGETEEGTWELDGDTVIMTSEEGEVMELTYADDQLILAEDGMAMIFEQTL